METWSWETGKQTHVWSKTVKVNALDSQEIGHWSDICSLLPSSPSSGKEFLVVEASGENWNSINFYLPTRLKDITFKASRRPNIIYRKSTKDHGNSGTSSDNFTQWFDFETDWPTTFVVLSCGGGGGGGSGGAAAGGHFTDNGFALVPGRFKKIGWVSVSQVLEELDISINCDWDFCQQQQEE